MDSRAWRPWHRQLPSPVPPSCDAEHEQHGRLNELCKSLIGPTPLAGDQLMGLDAGEADGLEAGAAQQPRWEASVLGLSKRELLEDVLHEMSRDRNLQRLVAQYRDALQDMEELAGGRG